MLHRIYGGLIINVLEADVMSLENIGVKELSEKEMVKINGGWVAKVALGLGITSTCIGLYWAGYKAGSRAITNKRDKSKKSFQKRR